MMSFNSIFLLIFYLLVIVISKGKCWIADCPFFLSVLTVFASKFLKLCFRYIYIEDCYTLLGNWPSYYYVISLAPVNFIVLNSTVSEISVATFAFFCLVFTWTSFLITYAGIFKVGCNITEFFFFFFWHLDNLSLLIHTCPIYIWCIISWIYVYCF